MGRFYGTRIWEMDEKTKKEAAAKISAGKTGSKNPQWKGGVSDGYFARKTGGYNLPPDECPDCQQVKKLEVHHLNGNHRDNGLSNLIKLCRKCHMKRDGRLESLRNGSRKAIATRWSKK